MNKYVTGAIGAVLLAGLCAGPALAAPRANTSQKGSLLIFPLISVDPEDATNTLIEISNDQNFPITVKCFYQNERKDKVDFFFNLTKKQTISWEVLTATGEAVIGIPFFPPGGDFGSPVTSAFKGELICFAVNNAVDQQVAWNHLSGTATVVIGNDIDATQPHQAFKYNAWAFTARGAVPDRTPVGVGGNLQLTGLGAGTYDACPAYNIANFNPNGASLRNSGMRTLDNDLVVVSCTQDLRPSAVLHTTQLQFVVCNAFESCLTGANVCIDSVASVPLGAGDALGSPFVLNNRTNFDRTTQHTNNARFDVRGVGPPFSNCPPAVFPNTAAAGLLGVLTSSVAIGRDGDESQEIGNTLHAAGLQNGVILWDPLFPVVRPSR